MSIKPLSLSLLAVVGITMFITNPSEEKYAHYAAKQVINNSSEIIIEKFCQGNDLCIKIVIIGGLPAKQILIPIIESTTKHDDFKLFSIYTTEVPGLQVTTIGVFNNFIPISGEVGFSEEFGLSNIF